MRYCKEIIGIRLQLGMGVDKKYNEWWYDMLNIAGLLGTVDCSASRRQQRIFDRNWFCLSAMLFCKRWHWAMISCSSMTDASHRGFARCVKAAKTVNATGAIESLLLHCFLHSYRLQLGLLHTSKQSIWFVRQSISTHFPNDWMHVGDIDGYTGWLKKVFCWF